MVAIPPLLGVALAGASWVHALLLPLWWVGYFFFYAGGQFLRARGKARYRPPVLAYGAATATLGVALLVAQPGLAFWALPYLPLIVTTAVLSWRRLDRSMLNDTVTVGAAGLMTTVAFYAAIPSFSDPRWPWVWTVTALITAYFLGTVFYVKTNIRERDSRGWLAASILFHTSATVAASLLPGVNVAHSVVWVLATVRAAVVPIWRGIPGSRLNTLKPKHLAMVIGFGEVAFSLAMTLTVL